jgi:hypothetical protein
MSPDRIKGGARHAPELVTLESEAQEVLNQLWVEKLLPFELSVGKITQHSGHYTIHFHDSRMYTADVPLNQDQSWADMVRAAVLDRVAKLSGPLRKR